MHTSTKKGNTTNKGEQNQKWLPHTCLLGGPKEGGNATSPLHSRGSPTKGNKIRSGCLTPAFSGPKRAEVLRHVCVLGNPQQRAPKSEVATSPLPSRGPKEGGSAMTPLRSRESPTEGDENKSGPQKGESAMLPLRSRGSPNKGTKSKVAHKWVEVLRNPYVLGGPQKGVQTWPAPG